MDNKPISTYYQYMKALTDYISSNGNEMLSEEQIQRFIKKHDLFGRFKITSKEVRLDAEKIIGQLSVLNHPEYVLALRSELLPRAKNGLADYEIERFIKDHGYRQKYKTEVADVRVHLANLVKGTWIPLTATHSVAFQTNQAYRYALQSRVQNNDKKIPLGEASIKLLLKRGGFDKTCGIDVETVKQDMYALPNKYNVLVLAGADYHPVQETMPVTAPPKKVTVSQQNTPTEPECTVDREIRTHLSFILNDHMDVLADRKRFSAMLKDLCPNRRREVNILLQAYDLRIIEEIKALSSIDSIFINRFTGKVVNEYGTNESLAKENILIWCLCYGHDVLQLPLDHSIMKFK